MTAVEPLTQNPAADPEWIVQSREGPKDTIDSVVVALILAFVFRAFVVEAFIIPTGSMAPTLYGAHATIVCEDCGTEFAYGLLDRPNGRNGIRTKDSVGCPNCNHRNSDLVITDESRNAESGDRILVLKWPFDIGGSLGPQRWDVVVFKDPSDGTTNFIKRLVGVPNEVVMIADGDLYSLPADKLSTSAREELEQIARLKSELGLGLARGELRRVSSEVLDELARSMRVAQKTDVAQDALWTVVYNHDFPSTAVSQGRSAPGQPRWAPSLGEKSGWDPSSRRVSFKDRGLPDDGIALTGKPIVASCAYNFGGPSELAGLVTPISDLRVRFVLEPAGAAGTLRVRLEKLGRVFWAVIRMDGAVSIVESTDEPDDDAPALATAQLAPFTPGVPVEVSFEHLDYHLACRVGDRVVVESSLDPGRSNHYGPDLPMLLNREEFGRRRRLSMAPIGGAAPPRIFASGGDLLLTHLVVEKDDYYFDSTFDSSRSSSPISPWADEGWGTIRNPILLRAGEYFMLGDNSDQSKDSRMWDLVGPHLLDRRDYQLGTVPEDQLIGKAFFVYWPSGIRPSWPGLNRYGIIPNVGRMRWIR